RLVMTAGLRSAQGAEYGARLTAVGAKTSGDFQSGSWNTVDLFLTQPVGAHGSFGFAINNILDEVYTPHLETQPAPGINMQASLTLRF
ncbi:MAG: TonB-dependent receptor, partial [Gemmobacter sp.]